MSQKIPPHRTHSNRSKVWLYFKPSDGDPDKAKCSLCAAELSIKGTSALLFDHMRLIHSLDRVHAHNGNDKRNSAEYNMTNNTLRNYATKNPRRDLNYFGGDDLTLTSMKPLPSSSLSRNLISRLNQLSSPVTRKLKFWNKKSFQVNQYDPSFKVIYLGNLGMQLWSKDESCLDKPLSTLWNNYLVNMKTEIVMRLTICNSGLKAITRQHGLTQYWSNRLVYSCSHKSYPRIFSWVYRHEGKKMRQELRCHAVLCPSPEKAAKMVILLNQRLACALQEFRREKKTRGVTHDSTSSSSSLQRKLQRTIPLRRQILEKGSANFRPPLERSKSAPKLTSICEEEYELDDEVSQDEYEFEESFGDPDDSDYGDEDNDKKVEITGGDDEDSTRKTESNSWTTTVHEETSDSGSVCATGDSSRCKREQTDQSKTPVATIVVNRSGSPSTCRSSYDPESRHEPPGNISSTSMTTTSQTKQHIVPVRNENEAERLSANTENETHNSSLRSQKHSVNNHDFGGGSARKFEAHGAKNSSTSHERPKSVITAPVTGEDPAHEIILSWSNLVIE